MSVQWPDDLVDQVVSILQAAAPTAGISGLDATKVLDTDMLPTDLANLPVVGVYIPQDKPFSEDPDLDSQGNQWRTAEIRIEVRAAGTNIRSATKALRRWVLQTLLANPTLNETCQYLKPGNVVLWGRSSDQRLGGADMDFEALYLFSPEAP